MAILVDSLKLVQERVAIICPCLCLVLVLAPVGCSHERKPLITMGSISARRLGKELSEIRQEGCPVGELCPHSCPTIHHDLCHWAGIKLVKADDFETWWFTIEVMGESLYKVSGSLAFHNAELMKAATTTGRGVHAPIPIRRSVSDIGASGSVRSL